MLAGYLLVSSGNPAPRYAESVETFAAPNPDGPAADRPGRALGWQAGAMLLPGLRVAQAGAGGPLTAYDARTDEVRWRYDRRDGQRVQSFGYAGPGAADLVILWDDGVVTRIDGKTGRPVWRLSRHLARSSELWRMRAIPRVGIVLQDELATYLLDESTGDTRWRSDTLTGDCALDGATAAAGPLIVGFAWRCGSEAGAVAVNAADGAIAWTAGNFARVQTIGNSITVSSFSERSTAILDPRTHAPRTLDPAAPLVRGDPGHGIAVTADKHGDGGRRISAFDVATGRKLWTHASPPGTETSSQDDGIVAANGRIYAGLHNPGHVFQGWQLWILDAATGRELARTPLPAAPGHSSRGRDFVALPVPLAARDGMIAIHYDYFDVHRDYITNDNVSEHGNTDTLIVTDPPR